MPTIEDVEASDKPFVEVVLYDLRECIDDSDWTYNLWLELFADHYGWSPAPLVDKYDAVLREEVPGYAAKSDEGADPTRPSLSLEDYDSIKPLHRQHFNVVLQDLQAWDWEDPSATYQAWYDAYAKKHGKSAGGITTPYLHLLKKLVPSFAERMRLNRLHKPTARASTKVATPDEDTPQARSANGGSPSVPVYPELPAGVPSYSGVKVFHQGLFHMMVMDINSRDWLEDPYATQVRWIEDFKHRTGYNPDHVCNTYSQQLRRHCPDYAARMARNKLGRGHAEHRAALHRPSWLPPPPPQSETNVHREVEPAHQAVFNLVIADLNSRDWKNAGATKGQFVEAFKARHGHNPETVLSKYGSLIRRLCPAYAHRMDANRRRIPDNGAAFARATPVGDNDVRNYRKRRRTSASSRSADSDIELLPCFPSDGDTAWSPLGSSVQHQRLTFRPRGPMAFPAALASLEIEAYRVQSSERPTPKLFDFGDFIAKRATVDYKRLLDRAEELMPLITSKEEELRPMAEAIDNVHTAIQHVWDELDLERSNPAEDRSPERTQATEALYERQDELTSRRAMLAGRRLELDKLRAERDKCLHRARLMDEVVVGAQARLEAVFMSDDEEEDEEQEDMSS